MKKTQPKIQKFLILAKTLYGLEEILAGELKALGANDITIMNRSVSFTGDKKLLYEANTHTRTAGRILMPLKTFKISKKEDLYKNIRSINWLDYMNPSDSFVIDSVVNFSKFFKNSMYATQYTKDAIVDQFRAKTGKRPSIDTEHPTLRINLHISRNEVTISLDSSGDPLHKRGYRTERTKAPLNENLAAGILLTIGYVGEKPFIDPMCGSGTFPIEAALIAMNIPPGLIRKKYAFMNWKDYDKTLYEDIINKAQKSVRKKLRHPIIASDKDKQTIEKAKKHAKKANVNEFVKFEKLRFEDQIPPLGNGYMVCNPPYGERLEIKEIEQLYSTIGDILKQKYDGYDAFIFSGNLPATKKIGLRASQKTKLFNGQLECRLLKYEMYRGSKKEKHLKQNNE